MIKISKKVIYYAIKGKKIPPRTKVPYKVDTADTKKGTTWI